ncbi:hypothetical protein [Actinoplanes derwentensis]|uniref:IPT/TIG domain-containing protein n=1 Tax=Actinoplanes derwentensis TaxID=113562 RepID=A0A1H2DA16_9ACTN|nr:hypothetical protein [Actinoplanes derwentensis]GID86394.1 hypothetical protein Ade03nite_53180 [Actinoplanes derwentensis]SDT79096.1 hypothetical protein SAMN04489716_8643 [Actinoplanes derwentensis]
MRKSRTETGNRPLVAGAAAAIATVAALASAPAMPAFAAATLTLSTSQVAISGGTVLYITGGTALVNTLGVRFALSANSCPANYNTAQTGTVDGGLITAIDTSTAYVTTPALPAATYKPCFYDDATTGGSFAADTMSGSGTITVTAVNVGTLSATTGQAADKPTLTASSAVLTGASYATQFVSGVTACPTTYTTPSSTAIVGTTVKTSTSVLTITVPATLTAGTAYYVCSYAGTTAGTSALSLRGGVTFASYSSTLPAGALVPTGGSSGTQPTLTVSTTGGAAPFTGTPAVLATRNSCPLTYPASVSAVLEPYAATTTKISSSKIAVTLPATVIVGGADVTTAWHICSYLSNSTGAAMSTAPAIYSVAPVLSVASAAFSSASGPAQGGASITITGLTGIPLTTGALLTASLGGSSINSITALSTTSFSGTTTAHAAGPVSLSVTTAAGTKTTATTVYTYTYGITVTPNTAASASSPILDITGAGFGTLTFGNVTTATALSASTAYVLLTDNDWNARDFATDKAAVDTGTALPVSYCNNILPISDGEIICTLNLTAMVDSATTDTPTITTVDVPDGTYTVTVVNAKDGLNDADYNFSVVSSGSSFTVSPF